MKFQEGMIVLIEFKQAFYLINLAARIVAIVCELNKVILTK